jgi:long-chain fatty acid transport protein
MKLWQPISIIALFITSLTCYGQGGFTIKGFGVQGMGNGGAFTARAEDGSALFHNPAGLSRLRYDELFIGADGHSSRSFISNTSEATWSSEVALDGSPTIFYNKRGERFSWGVGAGTTHLYNLEWDDSDFPARFLGTGNQFAARQLILGGAYTLGDHWSVGFSLRYAQSDWEWQRALPEPFDNTPETPFFEVEENYDVDGDGFGGSFGIQYYRGRQLTLGFQYTSPIDMDMDGNRNYDLLTRTDDVRAQNLFSQRFTGDIPIATSFELPANYKLGASFRTTVRTRLEMDFSYEDWSSIESWAFENPDGSVTEFDKNWRGVYGFHVAGDFQQRRALLWRLAIGTVAGSVPSETLDSSFPEADRFSYNFGVSYTMREKYTLEAGMGYVQNRDRESFNQDLVLNPNLPGYFGSTNQRTVYETQRWQFSMGLRIRLGVKPTPRR